jgi:hypothetical protein
MAVTAGKPLPGFTGPSLLLLSEQLNDASPNAETVTPANTARHQFMEPSKAKRKRPTNVVSYEANR